MKTDDSEDHLRRVRRICMRLPETTEKLSHGAPSFFVRKKVYAMFTNNHHNHGHIAVWLPAPPGLQGLLIHSALATYFKPPYLGFRGWIGIELTAIGDSQLAEHIREARRLIAPKTLK